MYAQQKQFKIDIIDDNNIIIKSIKGKADSLKIEKIIKSTFQKLVSKGYVLASVSRTKSDSVLTCSIHRSEVYKWGRFSINEVPEELLSRVGYHKKQFAHTRINTKVLGKLMVELINESDATGYPFASARLDSVSILKGEIFAVLHYSSGPKINYGSLELTNNFIKPSYLEKYLNIKEGDLFNGNKVVDISKKINSLSYAKLKEMPKVRFENKTCIVSLNTTPIKANKIDAIIGLAPNQIDNSKLLATGYINLDLHNLFRAGKQLTFNWRQFGVQSQTLKAIYNHTNLFGSVVDVNVEFDLFKQDTTFINRNFYLNAGYNNANYTINITSSFISSRLLSATSSTSLSNLELIDFNAQFYGLQFLKNEFDHPVNPQAGWGLATSVNMGAKNLLSTSFVLAELYDSLSSQSLQGNVNILTDIAFPVSKLMVVYSKMEGGIMASNDKLFTNDLFRLGGVNSVRGFNELAIYASSYLFLQVEARLLLGENSRLFGFLDWVSTKNEVNKSQNNFLGLGAGLLLDTSAGVIQLVYAVGKSSKQSLSLAESKIHIGYVARF